MYIGDFLHLHMCATCMPGAQEGQKRRSDPLELESQVIVSHDVGARNGTGILWKSSQVS